MRPRDRAVGLPAHTRPSGVGPAPFGRPPARPGARVLTAATRGVGPAPFGRPARPGTRVHIAAARARGVGLMEVLIAITLLSLLTVGMLTAMRVGLQAFSKTDARLMENRRVAGAQRILEQQIEGMIPVASACAPQGGPGVKFGFFGGGADAMRLVTAFSLEGAWRGRPQILEIFVIPGAQGRGVRLVVNEIPYTGPVSAGQLCVGMADGGIPAFATPRAVPSSFVLADQLALCRFSYLVPAKTPDLPDVWQPQWTSRGWPKAVRVEMVPLEPNPARLQPLTVTAPMRIFRNPELSYVD